MDYLSWERRETGSTMVCRDECVVRKVFSSNALAAAVRILESVVYLILVENVVETWDSLEGNLSEPMTMS
jgi:hypothetical protein